MSNRTGLPGQIIRQDGKAAFVVIPIGEWRRIETRLQDKEDAATVRRFLKEPSETFPDAVVGALLNGQHPVRVFREHRGMTQARLASAIGTNAVYLSQIERGGRRAGRKLQAKLSKALRVEPELLEPRAKK